MVSVLIPVVSILGASVTSVNARLAALETHVAQDNVLQERVDQKLDYLTTQVDYIKDYLLNK